MKRIAAEQDARQCARRQWLLPALSAIPAAFILSAVPRVLRAQSDGVKGGYAVSSAARAKQIQQLVSADLADKLRALADAGLGRAPHPRTVVHTQGLLPHEQDRDASLLSQEDWRQVISARGASATQAPGSITGRATASSWQPPALIWRGMPN
jgi:hypothetical protein